MKYSKQVLKPAVLFLSFWVFITTNSCTIKPGTLGAQYRIFVVADSALWQTVEPQMRAVFEKELVTPHTEKSYFITMIPLDKLNSLKDRMNIFFIGILNGKGAVDQYLAKYMPQNFIQGVKEEKYFYSFNKDMFARDQISLILLAKDVSSFGANLQAMKDEIYRKFTEKYLARLKKTMFERDDNPSVQKYLGKHFGWSVKLQQDYFIAEEDPDAKFVWLRRIHPNRWISIWESERATGSLSLDTLKKIRNRMARKYYQGDIVVDEDLSIETIDFNGYPAQKITGLWQNDSLLVGGPFRLYALQDTLKNKMYFVDIAVMAPGELKKPYLDQLEVMAHTFHTIKQK